MRLKTILLPLILTIVLMPFLPANSSSDFAPLCSDAGYTYRNTSWYQSNCFSKYQNQTPTQQLGLDQSNVLRCYCLAALEKKHVDSNSTIWQLAGVTTEGQKRWQQQKVYWSNKLAQKNNTGPEQVSISHSLSTGLGLLGNSIQIT